MMMDDNPCTQVWVAEAIMNGNLGDARDALRSASDTAVEALWVALTLNDRYGVPIDRAVLKVIRLLTDS